LQTRLAEAERVDFFGGAGRDKAVELLREIEQHMIPPAAVSPATAKPASSARFKARLWVTRPRPGVDRMACAWLIRRFIDPDARFEFASDDAALSAEAIPFDMYVGEFSHHGDRCTFEVLRETFALQDPALAPIAAIVHDLDLKDERFGAPQAVAVGQIVDGLRLAHADDHRLLAEGNTLFEALYRSLARSAGPPAPAARRRSRRSRS
jgi:hypothetical protein